MRWNTCGPRAKLLVLSLDNLFFFFTYAVAECEKERVIPKSLFFFAVQRPGGDESNPDELRQRPTCIRGQSAASWMGDGHGHEECGDITRKQTGNTR